MVRLSAHKDKCHYEHICDALYTICNAMNYQFMATRVATIKKYHVVISLENEY